jgi:hypothetical protein
MLLAGSALLWILQLAFYRSPLDHPPFRSQINLPCPKGGSCPLHSTDRNANLDPIARIREWVSQESLLGVAGDGGMLVHLEETRELGLQHSDANTDLSTLILALYSRRFIGPSLSYLIGTKIVNLDRIRDNRVRALILALHSSEGLDVARFASSSPPMMHEALQNAQSEISLSLESDHTNALLYIVRCVIDLEDFKARRAYLSRSEVRKYLNKASFHLLPALRYIPCVNTTDTSPVSVPVDEEQVRDSFRKAIFALADSLSQAEIDTLNAADRTSLALLVNDFLEINNWRLSYGILSTCSLSPGAEEKCEVVALSDRLAGCPHTRKEIKISMAITALEHVYLANDQGRSEASFEDELERVRGALSSLSVEQRKPFVSYLGRSSPFIRLGQGQLE